MRVIGGRLKGRRLHAPGGRQTRPTSDRLRESLFNILIHGETTPLSGARVIDLFAGSGALGIEAISRGAAAAIFVETARPALTALERNVAELGIDKQIRILRSDATRLPSARASVDIAFLDPPYGKSLAEPALAALLTGGWLALGSTVVVESGADENVEVPRELKQLHARRVGQSTVHIFRR